jgi:limonene-1,2-epoxide hydrolase
MLRVNGISDTTILIIRTRCQPRVTVHVSVMMYAARENQLFLKRVHEYKFLFTL